MTFTAGLAPFYKTPSLHTKLCPTLSARPPGASAAKARATMSPAGPSIHPYANEAAYNFKRTSTVGSESDAVSFTGLLEKEADRPAWYTAQFFDKTPQAVAARKLYIKTVIGGVVAISLAIFAFFSIFWGSVWKSPDHALPGWIVDLDGGLVGQSVSKALSGLPPVSGGVAWQAVPASTFPGGIAEIEGAILDEKVWYAVTINPGATANLVQAVAKLDTAYNSSRAVSFIGSEARNENIYRIHFRIVSAQLEAVSNQFAVQFLKTISSANNLPQLLSTVPQIVTRPVYFEAVNLRPFDVPVASAVTFVGLFYLMILSFFIVNVSATARQISGLENSLSLRSIILVRLATSCAAYLVVSLCYSLLNAFFELPFTRAFGAGGFLVFWILTWLGMLACGLALEAMLTLLKMRFVPFFLLLWIISNISATFFPIDTLPHVYRYGYVFPIYNISRAVRAIVFRTKDDVGLNFAVVLVWVGISCGTIPLFQWMVRRREAGGQRPPVGRV